MHKNDLKKMLRNYFIYWHDILLLDKTSKRLTDIMTSISKTQISVANELEIDDQPGDRECTALNWKNNLNNSKES